MCSPDSQVSAHYLVDEDGEIIQLVDERARAWHAGVSSWAGETDINSLSIGIEIQNAGHEEERPPPYPEEQIRAVIALCRDIMGRHGISPLRVVGHSDVAPARKCDPGEHFPWARLAAAGVAVHVPGGEVLMAGAEEGGEGSLLPESPGAEDRGRRKPAEAVRALQADLRAIGYGVPLTGIYCEMTRAVVCAFQRRFRPARVDGIADEQTRALIRRARRVFEEGACDGTPVS
jgi:N-acetylmuramoyl-L-alanine amidase